MEITKTLYITHREDWRNWLEENYKTEKEIWLVYYRKQSGKPRIPYNDAVEEALCFGWIDTTTKRLDDEKYMQRFSKRTKNGRWSKNTLKYGKRLIEEGKMAEAGLKAYKQGLKKKPLDHKLKRNPKTPEDLITELNKSNKAKVNFNKMAPSYKRFYLWWIGDAKRIETRKKRIKEVVERLKKGLKFGE